MRYRPLIGQTRLVTKLAFTLVEIVLAISIMMVVLMLAVPTLDGVFADKRLRRSFDGFNGLVRQAQERSVAEHRAYLIVWGDKGVALRPEIFGKKEKPTETTALLLAHGEALTLTLPAALTKKPPGEWIFWPSGICEPAVVQFKGRDGTWTADYSALTARAELVDYAAR